MPPLAGTQEAIRHARDASNALRWKLAVLSDCCTQHGEAGGAKSADDATELLGEIDVCISVCDGKRRA